MSGSAIAGVSGSYVFPTSEDARPAAHGLREHVAKYDTRPQASDDAAMSAAIDDIQDQLARDIPNLQREMDDLLTRLRRPGLN